MRVGLFFGSFDPPHIGHVNVVMGAINSSQVGRVLVIPAYQNLWKESSSKFSYRYAMSCMQFDTLPFVHVSDVEKDLAGPAYPRGIPTYVVSGHRDITPEEFEKFYVPAIVDVIDTCNDNYDDCEFVVGDCRGCDEMAANFIANYIKENTDDTECPPCILCIYHMFSEPRFRVGVAGQDGFYHVDMVDELNADLCEDDDPYTIDDCPIVHYVGGFETDRDRDSAMTNASSEDIAFIRSKSKWDSGTAENILRRHTMKYLNPSFYGQQ